jgi:hypothetical protein
MGASDRRSAYRQTSDSRSGVSPSNTLQRLRILQAGPEWHPIDLAQPDQPVPRGQHLLLPSAEPAALALGAPGGSPRGGR